MENITITIKGRGGQQIFFDENDRIKMTHIIGYLSGHLSNDYNIDERCGIAHKFEFKPDGIVIEVEPVDWDAKRIACYICQCYDGHFRKKYCRRGPQMFFEIG